MKNKSNKMINKNFIASLKNAQNGINYSVKNGRNIKIQLIAATVVLILMLIYKIEMYEFLSITISIFFVIFAEMINTAIEATVDINTKEYNEKAKIAKDVAAGAVLLSAINSVIVAVCIFFNEIKFQYIINKLGLLFESSPIIFVAIIVIFLIITYIFIKELIVDKEEEKNKRYAEIIFILSMIILIFILTYGLIIF